MHEKSGIKLVTSMEQGMLIVPHEAVDAGTVGTFDAASNFALEVKYDLPNLKNRTKYILLGDANAVNVFQKDDEL